MNIISQYTKQIQFALFFSALFISGCNMKDDAKRISIDAEELQSLLSLSLNPTSAKWEIFGTPEYIGGIPGPTEYITLIAELTGVDHKAISHMPAAKNIWIAPESDRKWISENFRSILAPHRNTTVNMSTYPNCHAMQATLRKSGDTASGFACEDAGKLFIYLTIADFTKIQ